MIILTGINLVVRNAGLNSSMDLRGINGIETLPSRGTEN